MKAQWALWDSYSVSHIISHFITCLNLLLPVRQDVALSGISDGGHATVLQFTYHTNAQMFSILKKTAAKCPQISRTYSIGRSVEGKDLLVIEFSSNPGQHELREHNLPFLFLSTSWNFEILPLLWGSSDEMHVQACPLLALKAKHHTQACNTVCSSAQFVQLFLSCIQPP